MYLFLKSLIFTLYIAYPPGNITLIPLLKNSKAAFDEELHSHVFFSFTGLPSKGR